VIPVLPAAALARTVAPAAITALAFGFKILEDGMRVRTEAIAFSAEVDVFCARLDQFLQMLIACEMRHLEARNLLEGLCVHAEDLIDRIEDKRDDRAQVEDKAKLFHLLNHMKKVHDVFQDSAATIHGNVRRLEAHGH
jgi:hypothetical protein